MEVTGSIGLVGMASAWAAAASVTAVRTSLRRTLCCLTVGRVRVFDDAEEMVSFALTVGGIHSPSSNCVILVRIESSVVDLVKDVGRGHSEAFSVEPFRRVAAIMTWIWKRCKSHLQNIFYGLETSLHLLIVISRFDLNSIHLDMQKT